MFDQPFRQCCPFSFEFPTSVRNFPVLRLVSNVNSESFITINHLPVVFYLNIIWGLPFLPTVLCITFSLADKPEVEVDNKIIHTGKGIDTTLTCRVYAMPEATVFWTRERDSKEIHESMTKFWMSHDRGTSEHTLKITNVDPDNDFDNYTCIAENKEGITHGVIELVGFAQTVNIKSKPAAYSPFASYNAEWEVVSHSPITQYKLRYRKTRDLSSVSPLTPGIRVTPSIIPLVLLVS